MERGRKDIQIGLQEENEDVWSTGRERGAVWRREECKPMEIEEKALKRVARYEEKALESRKELVKECTKERKGKWGNGQEGKRARKRKKGLEEMRNGATQMEAKEEQERMTADSV